jgi:peroxiredoxin
MNLMKNIIVVLFMVGAIIGCSDSNSQGQNEGITISGTVTNAPQSGVITIDMMQREGTQTIDTIAVADDNTYSYNFTGTAGYYRMGFFGVQVATVILDQDDIIMNFDGSNTQGGIMPEGSSEMDQIEKFYEAVNEEFAPKEQEINTAFVAASQAGDNKAAEEARADYMKLLKEKQKFSAALIRSHELNLATFQLVSALDKNEQLELIDSLAQALNTKYPGLFYIEDLVASMEKARATAIGVLAPEISLPNPEGEIVTLSSLRGSVVLVDFWAQWCKPCRMENPNVVKAYNKYKSKGFTVYGVSLDRTKEKWLQAIEEDGLTWTHVSDLKYFNSVAARAYGIEAIPFSILLDREGKIIAKNLRGQELEDALEKHFNKEAGM